MAAPTGCSRVFWPTTESSLISSTPQTVTNVEAAIKHNTKMVFVETPTNPVMIVTDLKPSRRGHAPARASSVTTPSCRLTCKAA
jgi:cystathionine beta-lyase/cystathionine gamma-synthase